MASPSFTNIFAAMVAVVNTKFPGVGELPLKRIVLQLKRAYKRNYKHKLVAAVFIAHLVNQQVAHEIIVLELLTLLLENLGEESDQDEGSEAASEDENQEDESESFEDEEQMIIKDETEKDIVNLRRTIYLTIMSSVDFEEAGHKLLQIKLQPGQEMELCIMLLECCDQESTYLRFYGLLGQRLWMINRIHQENFEKCFVQQYSMSHPIETNKLRNVSKFFAHLLGIDALPWHILAYIRLKEEDTTSSSRIFIEILFQELSEQLGIRLLNERLSDPTMQSLLNLFEG